MKTNALATSVSTGKPAGKQRECAVAFVATPEPMSAEESRFANETGLLPWLVAESICAEAANWLDDDRPMAFAPALAARATRLYSRNPAFARRMRAPGNMGREWLSSFMRHWLASYLSRDHRRLFERLPSSYCVGEPLVLPR